MNRSEGRTRSSKSSIAHWSNEGRRLRPSRLDKFTEYLASSYRAEIDGVGCRRDRRGRVAWDTYGPGISGYGPRLAGGKDGISASEDAGG